MEDWEKAIIRKTHPELIQLFETKTNLLSTLFAAGILSHDEMDEIDSIPARSDRNRVLLRKVEMKVGGYDKFKAALKKAEATGALTILEKEERLDKVERQGDNSAAATSIVVGEGEYTVQKIVNKFKCFTDNFHFFDDKLSSIGSDLEISPGEIKRIKNDKFWGKSDTADALSETLDAWVNKAGKGATLDKLIKVLENNGTTFFAEKL